MHTVVVKDCWNCPFLDSDPFLDGDACYCNHPSLGKNVRPVPVGIVGPPEFCGFRAGPTLVQHAAFTKDPP